MIILLSVLIIFSLDDVWILFGENLRWSLAKVIERLSITFTTNCKREFVPCDQVSSLLVVYYSLLFIQNISQF